MSSSQKIAWWPQAALASQSWGGQMPVTLDAGPGGTQPGPVPLRIVTDAVGFCQLVASRARPADLELDIAGDPGRAAGVLAAAGTLALD